MKSSRFNLFFGTFFTMLVLTFLLKNIIFAGLLTLALVMAIYMSISLKKAKARLDLLDTACDPVAFLKATEMQKNIHGKNPKYAAYLDIDRAAGLITLGQFEEAKTILLGLDKSVLPVKNGVLLTYTINLIICHYELGELEAAEALYHHTLPALISVPGQASTAMNVLAAERAFYIGEFEAARKAFGDLLESKLSKRVHLSILYRLAILNEDQTLFKQVAEEGNTLYIAQEAKANCK